MHVNDDIARNEKTTLLTYLYACERWHCKKWKNYITNILVCMWTMALQEMKKLHY